MRGQNGARAPKQSMPLSMQSRKGNFIPSPPDHGSSRSVVPQQIIRKALWGKTCWKGPEVEGPRVRLVELQV